MQQRSALIDVIIKSIRIASKRLVRDFNEVEKLQISMKGPGDFVTNADIRTEEILCEELAKARPGFGFLLESGENNDGNRPYKWIVDPINGTENFVHGYPCCCVNVALQKTNEDGSKEIVAAVTYDFINFEIYWAEKGKGAWLEKGNSTHVEKLSVASRRKIDRSMICLASISGDKELIAKLAGNVANIRSIGSSSLALAYVAAGKMDGFVASNIKPWESAAGLLLVSEARGVCYTFDKKKDILDQGKIIAANEDIYLSLQKLL